MLRSVNLGIEMFDSFQMSVLIAACWTQQSLEHFLPATPCLPADPKVALWLMATLMCLTHSRQMTSCVVMQTSFGLCEESEPLTPSITSLQVDEVWLTSTISDLLPEAYPDDLFFSNDSIMPAAAMAGAPPFLPFYTDAFPEVRWEGCPSNKRKRSNSDVA